MLGNVPDKRLERSLIKALGHPVEGRAQVVHELLAGVLGTNLASESPRLLNIGVTGLDPQKIGVRSKLLGALGRSWEPGTVVVEAFAGARAVARPDHRGLGVIAGQGSATRDGEIGVLLDMGLVGISCRLRSTLGLEMCVDSWRTLLQEGKRPEEL